MYDFEAATGLTQENVERMARERDAATLEIVCAWCGDSMGQTEGGPGISHGICLGCANDMLCETPA